jgi:hypothetical protein
MIRDCSSCGGPFEPRFPSHRLCWRCWREDKDRALRDAAWSQGYADGYRDGRLDTLRHSNGHQVGTSPPGLPDLLALIKLCHPDRHPGPQFELANQMTAELIRLREGGA